MKKLLVIGGGRWQIPLVKKIKSMGHYVICTNLYENSPAFKYSDESYVIDILDIEKNLKLAKDKKVDAVLSDQTDLAVKTVAIISEKLGLKTIGIKTAELFTNKSLMRKELKFPNLKHPKNLIIKKEKDLKNIKKNYINFPFIVKPVSSQSSRGVSIVNNEEELLEKYNYAKSYQTDSLVLIEELIGGIEITVEGIKTDLLHQTLGISVKNHFKNLPCIAESLLYFKYHNFDVEELKKINDAIYSNLSFGITHSEYKYFNGKFYLIEAAARGGGNNISSHIIPELSGIDVNFEFINMVLEKNKNLKLNIKKIKSVGLVFFNFKPGMVKNIEGEEFLENSNFILDYGFEFKSNSEILPVIDDRSRSGYFIISTDNDKELMKLIMEVKSKIKVKYL